MKVKICTLKEKLKDFQIKSVYKKLSKNDYLKIKDYLLVDSEKTINQSMFFDVLNVHFMSYIKMEYLFKKLAIDNEKFTHIVNEDFQEDSDDWYFALKYNDIFIIKNFDSTLELNLEYKDIIEEIMYKYFLIIEKNINFKKILGLDFSKQ